MFARRTFAVVFVADHHPTLAAFFVVACDGGEGGFFVGEDVDAVTEFAGVDVGGTEAEVVADFVEVSTELKPRTSGGDVVGGEFAFGFEDDHLVDKVFSVPCFEGFEELETLAVWADRNGDAAAVSGGSFVTGIFGGEALGGEFLTDRGLEFEIGSGDVVGEGVEVDGASESHCGNEFGATDKGVGFGVSVVSSAKVTVKGSDDRVFLAFFHILAIPLSDARAACVGEDFSADFGEGVELTIAGDGVLDLVGAGGDEEEAFDFESSISGLFGEVCGAADIFVRRVGAATDQCAFEFRGVAFFGDISGHLRDRARKVGGKGADDIGFEFREIDIDDAVKVFVGVDFDIGVSDEEFCVLIGEVGEISAVGMTEIRAAAGIVGEDGGGGTDLCAHVGDGGFSRTADGVCAGAEVFDDMVGSALDGEDSCEFEDHVFGGGPAVEFAGQAYADQFGHTDGPCESRHHFGGIGSTDTDSDHAESTGVGGMGVGSDHHTTGECVVFEDNLVDDACAGFPEAHAVFVGGGAEEVIDFFVDVFGIGEVEIDAIACADQVIAMDGGGCGDLGASSEHKLKDSHLRGGVLEGNAVRVEQDGGFAAFDILGFWIGHVAKEDLFGERQATTKASSADLCGALHFVIEFFDACSLAFNLLAHAVSFSRVLYVRALDAFALVDVSPVGAQKVAIKRENR